MITCNCPAYDFPHEQGIDCDLPSTCDYMLCLECTDPEGGYCDYAAECPLLNAIDHLRSQFYDTLEEKYLAEME